MVKNVYKIVVLVVVFFGAAFVSVNNMAGNFFNQSKNVKVGEESFPYLVLTSCGVDMNPLYGYSGNIEANIVRQSITPLDSKQSITIKINDGTVSFQKLHYQIMDRESLEVYEDNTINAIAEKQTKINIQFKYAFETSREYILSITGTTTDGQNIHYYTRLKYYLDDSNLDDKMNFAMKFHNATFSKDKFANEMTPYLETNAGKPNNSLAKVDITSDQDMITWAKLSPKVISTIVPVVKEYNMETACIQLNYYIKGNSSSGTEIYHVKEFFRIRYSKTRVFLLNYQRTMEAEFDEKLASTKRSQLKLGITADTESNMLTTKDGKHLFFVRDGKLFHFNMNYNVVNTVYSAYSKDASMEYRRNNETSIRINKIDSDGSIYFTVYGYFPRGEYEGKVAVVLYRYSTEENQLSEIVYLPMDTTYQQLKEDFDPYSYVNSKNVYYFTVGNIMYSYNILGKRLDIVKKNVRKKSFAALKNSSSYAWSSSLTSGYGESITLYNLETDQSILLKAPSSDSYIRLLGAIDSNVIYGFIKKDDISVKQEGSKVLPCYQMNIADENGKVLKSYTPKNKYITKVTVNGNVLTMDRSVKSGNSFKKISQDSILNQVATEKKLVSLESRVTTASLLEYYIDLPYGYILTRVPKLTEFDGKISTSEHSIHLSQTEIQKYYVYALGEITGAYESPSEAIINANKEMGVVISSKHQLVWERGGNYLMNTVSGIELKKAGQNITSNVACAYMIIKANHINVNINELDKSNKSVYEMLAKYMERPLNLSGLTLEEALYFVSSGKAVIGMVSANRSVVISGYSQASVTIEDPAQGKQRTIGMNEAVRMFKAAGNRFISYMQTE